MRYYSPPPGVCLAVLAAALSARSVHPQTVGYVSGFEGLAASPAGTQLWDPALPTGTPGQDGYYWPTGTTSVPFNAYTYAGNALGVPANPSGGGGIFIAGNGPGGTTFARAQRNSSYGLNTGRWTFATDVLVQFNGVLPTAQNVGSFSAQPFPGGQSFIMLLTWADPATAANWNASYVWFDAAGAQVQESPAALQMLALNTWYRWETDVNVTTNEILEGRVTDLTTNTTVTFNPVGRYLLGGLVSGGPLSGFRFFAGGGVAGNTIAWDNVSVTPGKVFKLPPPGPGPCTTPCCGPCCVPGNSFRVLGGSQLNTIVTFRVDSPAGVVTPGLSFAAVGISLTPDINPPCGTLLPGVVNRVLIGLPVGLSLFSPIPWSGPGSPVLFPLAMPPVNIAYVGLSLYAQGVFLDLGANAVVLLEGAQLILGA